MINTISLSYPWWYIIFCIILATTYSLVTYYNEKSFLDFSKYYHIILGIFRFLSVAAISFLLLSPILKIIDEDIKKPTIIFAKDVSSSTYLAKDSVSLEKLKRELETNFDVKNLDFGSTVALSPNDSTIINSTNFSNLFQYIGENYSDQNLGAVILTSDGIFNEGNNPLYQQQYFNAPLYTIPIGDTIQKKDLFISNVLYNKIAYLGDKIEVQVDILGLNANGENTQLQIQEFNNGAYNKIYSENIFINSNSFFDTKSFILDANRIGTIRYKITVEPINDEKNTINNTKEFFIEILDARQKILIIANSPHPDISAIKSIINENKNYQVEIAYPEILNGNENNFDLIIFYNLPSEKYDITNILNKLDTKKIPRIFIIGLQNSLIKLNEVQNLVTVKGTINNSEEITGEVNNDFSKFIISDDLKNQLSTFPPLIAPFGEYSINSQSNVFITQNIKNIKTNYPLIAFGEEAGYKVTVICGEGWWKWRLFDFLQNGNYNRISELINKTIQLTSIKSDTRKFRVNTSKNIYTNNDIIKIEAQLYNDNYEMINDPEVKVTITDDYGKEFTYTFSRTQKYYQLDLGQLPKGGYTYNASVIQNNITYKSSGKFNVDEIDLESFDLTAKHSFLRELSKYYGGKSITINNLSSLKTEIESNKNIVPLQYQTTKTNSLISYKLIFIFILLLVSVEWILRRYANSY